MTPSDLASLRAGLKHAKDAAKHASTPEAKRAAFRLAAELAGGEGPVGALPEPAHNTARSSHEAAANSVGAASRVFKS